MARSQREDHFHILTGYLNISNHSKGHNVATEAWIVDRLEYLDDPIMCDFQFMLTSRLLKSDVYLDDN